MNHRLTDLLTGVKCRATSVAKKILCAILMIHLKLFQFLTKEIADRVISQFDIGKDKTRVSLFKYSSRAVMVEEFELDA